MPRNVYFSQQVKSEQTLYEDLVVESLKIFGQDAYYMPRTLLTRDDILGEQKGSSFTDAYLIEAYIEEGEGFQGSGDLYSKFGLEIRDEVNFVISRRQWERFVGVFNNDVTATAPQEGDVIFLPLSNSFFEITFVEDEQPFYQLSNVPVFRLSCSLFEYNDEDIETGYDFIDDLQGSNAYQVAMDYTTNVSNQHIVGGEIVNMTVSDGVVVSGEVMSVTKAGTAGGTISVSNITVTGATTLTEFTTRVLYGTESKNYVTVTKVYGIGDTSFDANFMPQDDSAENIAFELAGDTFLDFTESNPFGDPSETY